MTAGPSHADPEKIKLVTNVLGLIAAILAVASAILTALYVQSNSRVNDTTDEVGTLRDQLGSAQASVSGLAASNGALQSQVDAGPATVTATVTVQAGSGTPAASATSAEPQVRHSGQLIVDFDTRAADIDAPASDVQWGRGSSVKISEGEIARYAGDGEQFIYAPNGVEQGSTAFTYSHCRYSQVLKPINILKLDDSSYVCFRTDDDRVSLLHVTTITNESVTFDVTTYEAE